MEKWFIAILMFGLVNASTICSYEGPDVSEDYVQVSNFLVEGPSEIKPGDEITVKFTVRNIGLEDLYLNSDGIFVATLDPDSEDASFGFTRQNDILRAPHFTYTAQGDVIYDDVMVESTIIVDKEGEWILWPSYHLSVVGEEKYGPSKWHACYFTVYPTVQDEDMDGVPDDEDNCPNTYNPAQTDVDMDGIGDECDELDDRDLDKDGVKDIIDNCPERYNPSQTDRDNNGVGDACEQPILHLEQKPSNPDKDDIVTFNVVASDASVKWIAIWVNNKKVKECNSSSCEYTGGPFIEGVYIFTAQGEDDENNTVQPGNVYIEGVSYDISQRIPSETCPACPEIEGLGECISQTCNGPDFSDIDPYDYDVVRVGCQYSEQGSTTPLVFFTVEGSENNGSSGVYGDYCSNNALVEYYCQGNQVLERIYECPSECRSGECVCSDTDEGREYYVKGNVGEYEDKCETMQGYIEYLKEYYCDVDGKIGFEYVMCPCNDGACRCIDTDGNNKYVKGHITEPSGATDYCLNDDTLIEYNCGQGGIEEITIFCQYGCEDGRCLCTDTDDGIDYYTAGSAGLGISDVCLDNSTLREYYMSVRNGICTPYYVDVQCPNGCEDGECIPSCSDGVQNQGEEGVDCGGPCPAECTECLLTVCAAREGETYCTSVPNLGSGSHANIFRVNTQIVQDTAAQALMEYADCLKDDWCRGTLPTVARITSYTAARQRYSLCEDELELRGGNYSLVSSECRDILLAGKPDTERYDFSEITADILSMDSNAIMEAVGYYVDKHMQYMYDGDSGSINACDIDEGELGEQNAVYTISNSGSRSGKISNIFLFKITSSAEGYADTLNSGMITYELRQRFNATGHPLSNNPRVSAEDYGWFINDDENYRLEYIIPENDSEEPYINAYLVWAKECPKDYCGDCEDHAILRAALMYALGISSDCAYCADHYDGYWGGGHTFNLVLYRNKWRVMDYGRLGKYFWDDSWDQHNPNNVWNNRRGTFYCPDWIDNLGDGHWDCGCDKTSPPKNYVRGDECPVERQDGIPSKLQTYRADICP